MKGLRCESCGECAKTRICGPCERQAIDLARKLGYCYHHPEGLIDGCPECLDVRREEFAKRIRKLARDYEQDAKAILAFGNKCAYDFDKLRSGDFVTIRLPQRFQVQQAGTTYTTTYFGDTVVGVTVP